MGYRTSIQYHRPLDTQKVLFCGRGGGQVASELAFYSKNLSSNPAEVYSFYSAKLFEENENKQKEAGNGSFKNIFSLLPLDLTR